MLRFFCALARQCFVNEYVFFCARRRGERGAKPARLRSNDALASGARDFAAAGLSRSRPIFRSFQLPGSRRSGGAGAGPIAWTTRDAAGTRAARRAALRASIPRLTAIDDDVSLKVRDMYEENPYPRWIKVAPAESRKPLDAWLREPLSPRCATWRARLRSIFCSRAAARGGRRSRWRSASSAQGARDRPVARQASATPSERRGTRPRQTSNYGQADILKRWSTRQVVRSHRIERRTASSR